MNNALGGDVLSELYQLDFPEREVEFLAAGRYRVAHRLKRPKFSQLKEREARIRNEAITVSKEETRSIYSEREANVWLWDQIAIQIRGYDIGDGDSEVWRDVQIIGKAIPAAHKIAAVETLYAVSARLSPPVETEEGGNGGGFRLLGGSEIDVILEIGSEKEPDFTVHHKLRNPSESEWNKYLAGNSEVREVRTPGSREKQRRVKVIRNLTADVELYNATFIGIEGAMAGGATFSPDKRDAFLQEIDPVHKQIVVQAISESLQIELGN